MGAPTLLSSMTGRRKPPPSSGGAAAVAAAPAAPAGADAGGGEVKPPSPPVPLVSGAEERGEGTTASRPPPSSLLNVLPRLSLHSNKTYEENDEEGAPVPDQRLSRSASSGPASRVGRIGRDLSQTAADRWRRRRAVSQPASPRRNGTDESVCNLQIVSPADDEAIQVLLVDPAERSSPAKRGDCVYRVGGTEYRVKHRDDGADGSGGGTEKDLPPPSRSLAKERRGSNFGRMFKKGGRKSGGGSEREENDNSNGNSNNNGGGNEGGGGDLNGDSNDDPRGQKSSGGGGGGGGGGGDEDAARAGLAFDPLSHFGPARVAFASSSTLPLHAGSESAAPPDAPSWTPVDGTEFKVRKGPNYPKNGGKEGSLESLYEVYCVRYYRSGKRTAGGASRIMPLPEMGEFSSPGDDRTGGTVEAMNGKEAAAANGEAGGNVSGSNSGNSRHPELKGTAVPDVLVVHFMLPYEPPNVFKQKDDGPGGECVYYLRPSKRFLDEMAGRKEATPAANLYKRWCETCQHDFAMRSRFKCMALVRDIDKHNFGLLKNYNGKPVLITESGRAQGGYYGDVRYLEMTANGELSVSGRVGSARRRRGLRGERASGEEAASAFAAATSR
ncbi:hypothetical protein ACHAWF_010422 [Thalassiosira exigua]